MLGCAIATSARAQEKPSDTLLTVGRYLDYETVSDPQPSPDGSQVIFTRRFVDKMKGEIYCGFAETDALAPPSTIETLVRLFKNQAAVRYRSIVHPGTVHGYALPDRDIFDKAAANRDWENIFAMFKRQLG